LAVSDNETFNCTRCGTASVPGTKIAGFRSGESHRVYQCPTCEHVDLRQMPAQDDPPDPEPDGEPGPP
jgi:hypothetical protein